jgi:hypothetical protein
MFSTKASYDSDINIASQSRLAPVLHGQASDKTKLPTHALAEQLKLMGFSNEIDHCRGNLRSRR